jgi:hypothetical protein
MPSISDKFCFKVTARDTTGTGDQSFTFADGSADAATNLLGITSHTAAVASLTTSPQPKT